MTEWPTAYAPVMLLLSVGLVLVWAIVAYAGARDFHTWHDDRAALALASRLGVLTASIGLLVSAFGLQVTNGSEFAAIGLGVTRGALLVAGLTLAVAGLRR